MGLTNWLVETGVDSLNTLNTEDAKERILSASIDLFSRKGFDATRVNEIAESAGVNKALIYYYFKNKEDILDTLLEAVLAKLSASSMEFINSYIVPMIKAGRLDIVGERFEFADGEAMEYFQMHMGRYYEKLVDYLLTNRAVVRILMFESLRSGKHKSILFRLMKLMDKDPSNPIYRTLQSTDEDFDYNEDTIFFKFFFSWIPLISIAAYYDEYKAKTLLSDESMKELTIRSLENLVRGAQERHFVVSALKES
jgi:AcrR family transcriptional regulator